MRFLYTLVWILALPLVLLRLLWRSRFEPGYRKHIAERLGLYFGPVPSQPVIWVHAVSVGETRAAEPLIQQLRQHYPSHRILLTHMTPTGRATGAQLFSNNEVAQCYVPYDIPTFINRFLNHFNPVICILMETEIWPNLIHTCRARHIPVMVVNARLSLKSYRKGRLFTALFRPASAAITSVFAQTSADAERIRDFGARQVTVTGNMKFDVKLKPEQITAGQQLRQQFGNRRILLCASTREGEEELILKAFVQSAMPEVLLIIVPRHPQRFDVVEALIKQHGLTLTRRTVLGVEALPDDVRVLLGDSMGELISYYASADVAYIGGSLLPLGGQNLIEACAVEKPILIGPHTFNFEAISHDAIDAKCAMRVGDAQELMECAKQLLGDQARRLEMGRCALAFANQHQGATERTLTVLQQYIH